MHVPGVILFAAAALAAVALVATVLAFLAPCHQVAWEGGAGLARKVG
jgi:hypothetical protein